MEISAVRNRVRETLERARRVAAERRTRVDQASREYARFLEEIATPLMRQISAALKASGYPFSVITPAGAVRLTSDKTADDYIEVSLDTSGDEPLIVVQSRHARGRRVIESERPLAERPIPEISEADTLDVLLKELEPLVER